MGPLLTHTLTGIKIVNVDKIKHIFISLVLLYFFQLVGRGLTRVD